MLALTCFTMILIVIDNLSNPEYGAMFVWPLDKQLVYGIQEWSAKLSGIIHLCKYHFEGSVGKLNILAYVQHDIFVWIS